MSPEKKVSLVASRVGYEERRLLECADSFGLHMSLVDTRSLCTNWDLSDTVCLNREISADKALLVAESLERDGVRCVNTARGQRLGNDKWLTHLELEQGGFAAARTVCVVDASRMGDATTAVGGEEFVLKHRHGSWGRNVARARAKEDALTYFDLLTRTGGVGSDVVLVQEFIGDAVDLRIIVVGGRAVGCMERSSQGWRRNAALGAQCKAFNAPMEVIDAAEGAAKCIGLDVCGVDVLLREDGSFVVLEINPRVEFRGFESALGRIVAEEVCDFLARRICEEV